jgi:DNA-binding MarR family transcriptional regulator
MSRRRVADRKRALEPVAARGVDRLDQVTAPEPLGAVLEFLRALWSVNHALESTSRKMKSQLGVTGPERMVVRLVGRYPGISAGDLARILHVHPSTLTGLLKRLVARGLLLRKADRSDARRALFDLTRRGRGLDGVRKATVEAGVMTTLETLADRDVRSTLRVLESLSLTLQKKDR